VSASRIAPAPPQDTAEQEPPDRFLKHPEVRDVLAWMRLLVDPQDAAAVVRALARPPIELRQVELARVIQVARRRKRDLVLGVAATTESPQVPPEVRERVRRFVELHRSASAELDTVAPDVFVARLIQRLGVPGRELLTRQAATRQDTSLARLSDLAVEFARERPDASTRDLTRHLATVVPEPHEDVAEREPARDSSDRLEQTLELMRQELLDGVARIGGRLGELRLDTDLDVSHGVARYLELLKLSALMQRPDGQSLADALEDINARVLAAATPLQREILQTSALDETLLAVLGDESDGGDRDGALARAIAPREEHSLSPFLPRRGVGAALSASDIFVYRSCPLRYKFARVLRIPTPQTVHQRFGIVVHQVLERFHSESGNGTRARMLELLDAGWRRAGFGDGERDRELFEKAQTALSRYHERLRDQDSEPVWFERQFDFRVGPHHVRGRVDRVDRVAGDAGSEPEYELIDYKTSRPKTAEQLSDDVQLSLYALAANEDWQLPSSRQAYYYVLDDLKVPVRRDADDAESVTDVVMAVGEGVLAQEFEPTPSPAACSMCDYRIVCPAAEAQGY
jgi:CRISPR/Cas system-associated exonuclease Cas4 (RecB family)